MRPPLVQDVARELEAAQVALQRATTTAQGFHRDPVDPASVYRPHSGRSADRAVNRNDREAEAWNQVRQAQQRVTALEHQVARGSVERHLAREDVVGAVLVRTAGGWHTVVRVNARTVSVATGYSWVDRYPFDRLLEVRHLEQTSPAPDGAAAGVEDPR